MLFIVSLLKAYGEILLLCMAARGVMRLLGRQRVEDSVALRILSAVVRPWLRLARWMLPRAATERHAEILAACLVVVFWVAASTHKGELCRGEAAREPACREFRYRPPA